MVCWHYFLETLHDYMMIISNCKVWHNTNISTKSDYIYVELQLMTLSIIQLITLLAMVESFIP